MSFINTRMMAEWCGSQTSHQHYRLSAAQQPRRAMSRCWAAPGGYRTGLTRARGVPYGPGPRQGVPYGPGPRQGVPYGPGPRSPASGPSCRFSPEPVAVAGSLRRRVPAAGSLRSRSQSQVLSGAGPSRRFSPEPVPVAGSLRSRFQSQVLSGAGRSRRLSPASVAAAGYLRPLGVRGCWRHGGQIICGRAAETAAHSSAAPPPPPRACRAGLSRLRRSAP